MTAPLPQQRLSLLFYKKMGPSLETDPNKSPVFIIRVLAAFPLWWFSFPEQHKCDGEDEWWWGGACLYVCSHFCPPKEIISDDSAQWLHMLACKVLLIWRAAEMDPESRSACVCGGGKCPTAANLLEHPLIYLNNLWDAVVHFSNPTTWRQKKEEEEA